MPYNAGMSAALSPSNPTRFLPVLSHIQTNLTSDLSLDSLAEFAGLSPFHFQRQFLQAVGETPKQYTQRLRLEQAAYHLKILRAPILDVALKSGFQTHETFTRAFRRHFGVTPSAYRRLKGVKHQPDERPALSLNNFRTDFQLSKPEFLTLQPLKVAFIRHLGPYVEVDLGLFDRLIEFAKRKGFYRGDNLLMGIGHDDPSITPAKKVRFDACIEVPNPFKTGGEIGFYEIPESQMARTTYIGPYGRVLEQAYGVIFHQLMGQSRYRILGIPAIEIYRTTRINPGYELNHIDIYLTVEKI